MSKLGEALEAILQERTAEIVICSEDNNREVCILVKDISGPVEKDLAVGFCDWTADENLETILIQTLTYAMAPPDWTFRRRKRQPASRGRSTGSSHRKDRL